MGSYIKFIFCLSIGLLAMPLKAQETFKQSLDSTMMIIGDQQYLTLQTTNQNPGDFLFEILDTMVWFQTIDKGSWNAKDLIQERKILFTVFDSGYFKIPALGIFQKMDSMQALGNPLFIDVQYPIDSVSALRPIKNIEETEEPYRFLYLAGIGILVLFGMLFVLWQFFKADQMKPEEFHIQVERKIWEKCLDDLYALEAKKLWQQNLVKPYYDELNLILRNYLFYGMKIPALEYTSAEIMETIADQYPDLKGVDTLKECFTNSDLVKFANANPNFSVNEKWMQFAIEFVRLNKELSEKVLEEKRLHWRALLGETIAAQFENPMESVPLLWIQVYDNKRMQEFSLIQYLLIRKSFKLPESWVQMHLSKTGLFYRWQHTILNISNHKFIQVLLFLFVLPFISIFLPFIFILSIWKKESLFSRGIFSISKNQKLVLNKEIK